jgi:hypothetical protein
MSIKIKIPAALLLLLWFQLASAQSITTGGTVLSKTTGEPLSGVSITVKNGRQAATTNTNGSFSITAPENSLLIFSYVGYQQQEITLTKNSGALQVSLQPGENALNEVVVTALGINRQKNHWVMLCRKSNQMISQKQKIPISLMRWPEK